MQFIRLILDAVALQLPEPLRWLALPIIAILALIGLLAVLFVVEAIWNCAKRLEARWDRQIVDHHIRNVIRSHAKELGLRRELGIRQGRYNTVDSSGWIQEILHFIEVRLGPSLKTLPLIKSGRVVVQVEELVRFVDFEVRAYVEAEGAERSIRRNEAELTKSSPENAATLVPTESVPVFDDDDPLEFEKWCKDQLVAAGWIASLTSGSGDQGVDIVAIKKGVRAVFQCKLWRNPVGNKAVQEVFAGQTHYGASLAFVISESGFTRRAEELAERTSVLLITSRDLRSLDRFLSV